MRSLQPLLAGGDYSVFHPDEILAGHATHGLLDYDVILASYATVLKRDNPSMVIVENNKHTAIIKYGAIFSAFSADSAPKQEHFPRHK